MQLHFFSLCAVVGLAGCVVGSDYQKPALTAPEHWLATNTVGPAGPSVDTEDLKNWWQSFGDAQLSALMERALAENLDLKIAQTHITQARAERSGQ